MSKGVSAMAAELFGHDPNEQAVAAWVTGKQIAAIKIEERDVSDDCGSAANKLVVSFSDGRLELWDSCWGGSVKRYMRTDDNLVEFVGGEILKIEVRYSPTADLPENGEECCTEEIHFLAITTTKGTLVLSNHVEHNGYYGGFVLDAKFFPSN